MMEKICCVLMFRGPILDRAEKTLLNISQFVNNKYADLLIVSLDNHEQWESLLKRLESTNNIKHIKRDFTIFNDVLGRAGIDPNEYLEGFPYRRINSDYMSMAKPFIPILFEKELKEYNYYCAYDYDVYVTETFFKNAIDTIQKRNLFGLGVGYGWFDIYKKSLSFNKFLKEEVPLLLSKYYDSTRMFRFFDEPGKKGDKGHEYHYFDAAIKYLRSNKLNFYNFMARPTIANYPLNYKIEYVLHINSSNEIYFNDEKIDFMCLDVFFKRDTEYTFNTEYTWKKINTNKGR